MALAKARKVVVDGREYQWKVSTHGKFHLAVFDPVVLRKLIVYFESHRVVMPRLVKSLVKEAEAAGWEGSIRWDR